MTTHHTKDKGDLGVLKAQVDLAEKGYLILIPLSEHSPFDIVIYKDNRFRRVQVKYRSLTKKNTLELRFRSSWADRKGSHEKKIDKNDIDLICIYCPEKDTCYYINPKEWEQSVTLRFEPPKNNQSTYVHYAKDYTTV